MTSTTDLNTKQKKFLNNFKTPEDVNDFLVDVAELNNGLNRLVQKKNFLDDTLWSVVMTIYSALFDLKMKEYKDSGEADYHEWDHSPSRQEIEYKFIMFAQMDLLNEDNQKSLLDMVSLMYCDGCRDDMNYADFCRMYHGEEEW